LAATPGAAAFEVAYLLGQYYEAMSDYLQAQAAMNWALESSREDGDLLNEMRSLTQFGMIAYRQGEYDQANIWYSHALALLQDRATFSDPEAQVMVVAFNGLGVVHREQGEFDQARTYHERALTLCRQIGDRRGEARAFNDLGATASYQRDFAQALNYYQQALAIRQAIGNRAGEGATLNNLAQVTRDAGNYGQALEYLSASLAIMQAVGNRWGEVNVWNDLGIMYQELGDLAQAQICLERGQQIAREIDDEVGQAYLLDNLGLVAYDRGDLVTAESLFNQGKTLAEAHDDKRLVSNLINHLSMVSLSTGKLDQSLAQATTALAMRREMDLHVATVDDLATLAATCLAAGDKPRALVFAQQTMDILAECDGEGPEFPQRGYFICYQVLKSAGQPESAGAALQSAYDFVSNRANRIIDPDLRRSFLEKVAINREIVAEFKKSR
jgi:tetratricopeptide (TPR) repeat protein